MGPTVPCSDTVAGAAGGRPALGSFWGPGPRGGQPLGSGRQLPPQLTVGRRPLGGGGGGGGGALEGGFREGRLGRKQEGRGDWGGGGV